MRKTKSRLIGSIEVCTHCGKRILMCGHTEGGRISHIMDKERVCFECAYWMELVRFPKKNMEVAGGICLIINPPVERDIKSDKSLILGSKGRQRFFMRTNGNLVISNDVWMVGEIPEPYRESFQRTVYEITRTGYSMLVRFNKRCQAKRCFDRYHCLRYDVSLEGDSAGTIPKNWKRGGERCPTFMDKSKYVIN